MQPYLAIVAFSLLSVIILKPLYDRFFRWVGGRAGLATMATLAVFFLAILVPLWLAGRVAANQFQQMAQDLEQPGSVEQLSDALNTRLRSVLGPQAQLTPAQQEQIRAAATGVAKRAAAAVVNLGMSIPTMLASLFVFLGIVGVLLPTYDDFVQRIKRLSPLDDAVDALFLRRIKLTVWAMFIAIFVIAVVQGLVMGLFIWFAGVPYAPLWTLLSVVCAMLPLGASLIAIPLGIAHLLIGNYTAAVIILAGYLLVVSNLDTFIRPRLVPKEAYLNFALVLISALGGYALFGFFGVVYGPVVMIMFLTTLEVYEMYYANDELPAAPLVEESPTTPVNDQPGGAAVFEEPATAAGRTVPAVEGVAPASDDAAGPTSRPDRPELPDEPPAG